DKFITTDYLQQCRSKCWSIRSASFSMASCLSLSLSLNSMFKALATWLRFRPIAPSCRHDSRTVFTSSSVRTGIRFNDRSHFCT
ncbi:TPA: hypothetical protein ACWP1R_005097, partial [Escherichia coli]